MYHSSFNFYKNNYIFPLKENWSFFFDTLLNLFLTHLIIENLTCFQIVTWQNWSEKLRWAFSSVEPKCMYNELLVITETIKYRYTCKLSHLSQKYHRQRYGMSCMLKQNKYDTFHKIYMSRMYTILFITYRVYTCSMIIFQYKKSGMVLWHTYPMQSNKALTSAHWGPKHYAW